MASNECIEIIPVVSETYTLPYVKAIQFGHIYMIDVNGQKVFTTKPRSLFEKPIVLDIYQLDSQTIDDVNKMSILSTAESNEIIIQECEYCHYKGDNEDPQTHILELCPKIKCEHCGECGHSTQICTVSDANIYCRYCGVYGHTIVTCHNVRCKTCGQKGHTHWLCGKESCSNCGLKNHPVERCWFPFEGDTEDNRVIGLDNELDTTEDILDVKEAPKVTCRWCSKRRLNDCNNHHISECKYVECFVCGITGHIGQTCDVKDYIKNEQNKKNNDINIAPRNNVNVYSLTEFPSL